MKKSKRRQLQLALRNAESYEAWLAAAIAHDQITGGERWKSEEQTRIYDYAAISSRLKQLKTLRQAGDDHGLLFALNEGIHRNMGNMGRPELYTRAMSGTKQLITDYMREICVALQHLAAAKIEDVSAADKLEFFRRASLCFGRSALLLSGGGIFGYFHVGVLRALIEHDLLPRVISGASAGSLMAAIVGTNKRNELPKIFEPRHLQIQTDARNPDSRHWAKRLLPRLDVADIRRHIDRLVPDLTFAEAYRQTGLYINISVSPAELHQSSRLLNAITSPDIFVRSAVIASCAVPGVYPAVTLMARNRHGKPQPYLQDRKWVDGSLSDDVPARRLSRLYGVNHYIVSQVNPFALMQPQLQPTAGVMQDVRQFWHHTAKNAGRGVKSMTDKYGRRWPELRHAVNGMISVWMQEYGGDINILPPPGLVKPWKGMGQTTQSELTEIIRAGERATWPKLNMICNCTQIGRVLDEILGVLSYDISALAQRIPMPAIDAGRNL